MPKTRVTVGIGLHSGPVVSKNMRSFVSYVRHSIAYAAAACVSSKQLKLASSIQGDGSYIYYMD